MIPLSLQNELKQIDAQMKASASRQTILVSVTKYAAPRQMVTLYEAGIRHFGENKVQDALAKKECLQQQGLLSPEELSTIQWHLIGHLQGNKVNKAVGQFDWIHSVDSLALARKIDKRAEELGIRQNILLQVNISQEESKSGFTEEELLQAVQSIGQLPHIRLCGLMTIAPAQIETTLLKNIFYKLGDLLKTCQKEFLSVADRDEDGNNAFKELSMGMSDDYEVALSCGATIIRVGRNLIRHI